MITWGNKYDYIVQLSSASKIRLSMLCVEHVRPLTNNTTVARYVDSCLDMLARELERGDVSNLSLNEKIAKGDNMARLAEDGINDAVVQTARNAIASAWACRSEVFVPTGAPNELYPDRLILKYVLHYMELSFLSFTYGTPRKLGIPDETIEQFVALLRTLYFESLPEEQKNCWLVQACL